MRAGLPNLRSRPGPRAGVLGVLLTVVLGAGCAPEAPVLDLHDGSRLRLAMTDPGLASRVGTYIAAMFLVGEGEAARGCRALLDYSLEELEDHRRQQPLSAAAQAFQVNEAIDAHAFGAVHFDGLHAFLVLGSLRPDIERTEPMPLREAQGTVIAMGCREIEVSPGDRFDLDVVLFPAGLR